MGERGRPRAGGREAGRQAGRETERSTLKVWIFKGAGEESLEWFLL